MSANLAIFKFRESEYNLKDNFVECFINTFALTRCEKIYDQILYCSSCPPKKLRQINIFYYPYQYKTFLDLAEFGHPGSSYP